MFNKNLFIGILLFLTIPTIAKENFKRLGLVEGLSAATVECFVQDHAGFIWIGTSNGLNRFDGYQFVKYFYQKNDTLSLINNNILCVYEDNNKQLFIGTSGGLQLYNSLTDKFIFIPFPDGNFPAKTIFQDSKGDLWIGSLGGGLYKYSATKQSLVKADYPILTNTSIDDIIEDKQGNIWIGTESSGVFVIEQNSNTILNLKNGFEFLSDGFDFSNSKVSTLCEDKSGNIWFGTYGNGIFKYDKTQNKILTNIDLGIPETYLLIAKVLCDVSGNVLIGIDGFGVLKINNKAKELFTHNEQDKWSISSNAIHTIYEDKQQNIWIGAFSGGISFANMKQNNPFKLVKSEISKNSLSCSNVTDIATDKTGNLWIATDGGGLNFFNTQNQKFSTINPVSTTGLNYKNPLCLLLDNESNIWCGYYRGGYISIENRNNAIIKYSVEIKNVSKTGIENDIRSLIQDKKGNIWIATNGQGLICFNPITKETKHFVSNGDPSKSIPNNFIRSLFQDSKGYIWIGSTNGLSRYLAEKNKFVHFVENRKKPKSLSSNTILDITETTNGYMCFATAEGLSILNIPLWSPKYIGLGSLNSDNIFENYSVSDGLPDHTVASIIEDNNRNLWLGTGKGLSMFDAQTKVFKNFSVEESFDEVFNSGACFKDKKGRLYFGSVKGLVSFVPDSINDQNYTPLPAITSIKVDFEYFPHPRNTEAVKLHYSQKVLSIEFSALEMFSPKEIRYQYMLEGFDTDWISTTSNQRLATYTNLNAGTYEFKLKATNKNGIWCEGSRNLTITIMPPFWKTYWFIAFIILAILAGLYSIYKIRINSIKKLNRKLEILVTARTNELMGEREKQKQQEIEKNELLVRQKELEANRLKYENELIQLRNLTLQNELERSNTEMEKKNNELVLLAVQTTQRMEFMAKLKKSLIDILSKANNETQSMIKALVTQIEKDNDAKKEWDQFEQHFNQTNNKFFIVLKSKYPDLTPHDLRICAYLRMNLSNKEIAVLQNISVRGVEKSRFRLRKKFLLENDMNIVTFLMNIGNL
jgi:ligand-binding sensor domain-containing protein/DNA-binding CsgD family transcriptional regulator